MTINHFCPQFRSSDLFDWNLEIIKNRLITAKMQNDLNIST